MDSRSFTDSSMMFDWSDQDQVEAILWPDLTESEDHTVPQSMETEHTTSAAEDYKVNKRYGDATTDLRSTEQSSQAKMDDLNHRSESSSNFHTNEDCSSSRIEIDPWLVDFPNLSIELKDAYADGDNHNSIADIMNDLTRANTLSSGKDNSMQLDHEGDLFGHEGKENNDFLDCDWATFGDFDDVEKLFRKNDPVFGHDMIGVADGFLSPSKDVIDSTAQSIPMPDLPLCKELASNEGCSSLQLNDHHVKQSPSHGDKVEEQKIVPMGQDEAEERKRERLSKNLKDNFYQDQHIPSTNMHSSVITTSQNIHLKSCQQMQFGDTKVMQNHGSSNQVAQVQYGYPTSYFPGMQLPTHLQIERDRKRAVPASYEDLYDDHRHPKTSSRLPDTKPASMTPREKMEKLRRRQHLQAQLAIEQQQQQYGHQITFGNVAQSKAYTQINQIDSMTSTVTMDECEQKVPSSELSMVSEKDESKKTPGLTDEPQVQETIYYQLQDIVEKLDMRTRLCIRDSLFRLARSAMERQSVSDRSSTNTNDKDEDEDSTDEGTRSHDRYKMWVDSETDTNPIDRVVANLLFQRPTEACPRLSSQELISST